MFVSNIDPSINAAHMYNYLLKNGIKPKWVVQTKPMYDSYSSFVIAVTELPFETLSDRNRTLGLWNDGTIVKEYCARKESTVLSRFPAL